MPVRHRHRADGLTEPQPKRCRHCDETRSPCGADSEGSEGRESWRVTLDHDLVETLSAIYPEWFKPARARSPSPAASPAPSASSSGASCASTPYTPVSDDALSWCTEDMALRPGTSSGSASGQSPPRVSPPKVVVDDSPLQPAMGKHKESLKVKLMMRRPINQLVAQGIMPPLKTPPAYFEQCKQLERAKTGDLLKAKIQKRPDRQELERRHILDQESHVDPSLAEKQRMLKKARLADQLNDQLSHRPGPLELIKKNILHTEETIETAVKSGTLSFTPTSEGACRPAHPLSYEEASPSPSPPALPPQLQHPAPGKDKNRKKVKHKHQPKARFKFHEYKGPPNAKPSSPPGETSYELMLQQQNLLLQLMLPPSPSSSDCSEPPPHRLADMKVSDLRAECKRRNLRVSGPKPQLLDRLRPYLDEEAPPPAPPAPPPPAAAPPPAAPGDDESEDIVRSQRRQIEELERKLEASRQQLEAVRREAAGAAAADQGKRLLQAHLCVSQLRAQLDALTSAPPRVVLAAEPAERLVRFFTVASPPAPDKPAQQPTYILNGVKVVPIAILPQPQPQYEPPPPPPPPPPPEPLQEDEDSQIMDDVLEILVENGELPASAVGGQPEPPPAPAPPAPTEERADEEYLAEFPGDAELQRELDDILRLEAPLEPELPALGADGDALLDLLGERMDVDSPPPPPLEAPNFDNMEELAHAWWGRPPRDPLLAAVLAPPPRPLPKHYSWDRVEFDAT